MKPACFKRAASTLISVLVFGALRTHPRNSPGFRCVQLHFGQQDTDRWHVLRHTQSATPIITQHDLI